MADLPAAVGAAAPGPAIDTGPPDGAPAPRRPKNYSEYYARIEDVLQQRCDRLCRRHAIGNPQEINTPEELYALAVTSSDVIPKVYLYLVETASGVSVEAVHRVFKCASHPLVSIVPSYS